MRPAGFEVILMMTAVVGSGSLAATWIVDPAGNGDALTIQGGVDLAADDDVILIRPGTYGEQVTLPRPLSLIGESGRDVTIVDAEDARAYCIRSNNGVSGTLIEGLTLTGVNGGYGYCTGVSAIRLTGSGTIRDCAIVDNLCPVTPVSLGDTSVITGTVFSGNQGMGWGCGQIDPDHGSGCVQAWNGVTIDGCTFEGNTASDNSILDIVWGQATVRNSVFRNNQSFGLVSNGMFVSQWGGSVLLEHNLFVDNQQERLFGDLFYGGGAPLPVIVSGNTFARNEDLFVEAPNITDGSLFDANVFTGATVGLQVPTGTSVLVSCNDSWGNGTNWIGVNPGTNGNFSADPKYCAPQIGDFTLAANSPLLPENNSCGKLIGAFQAGCGPVSVNASSWGRIKGAYRE